MANDEEHERTGSVYAATTAITPERRSLRRKQAVVGVTGAAAVLAGAAFFITQVQNVDQSGLPEPAALAPQTAPSVTASPQPATATPTRSPSRAARTAAPQRRSPKPTPSLDASVAAEIAAARAAASADGVPLNRPLTPAPGGQIAGGPVSERTETTRSGTIQVTTARHDLSGQGKLLIAADQGTPHGKTRCTNKVRFSSGVPARQQPTMLLCWRTSAQRSVVTVAVAPTGKPATAESLAVIEREWAKLD